MNTIRAKSEEIIITTTLAIPKLSALPIAPDNGLINPNNIRKVITTATCAKIRFPFRNPGVTAKRIIPAKTGISAVTDGVSEVKYAQLPKIMRTIELKKLILYGFIFLDLTN